MEQTNKKFLQFPLFLLRNIFSNKKDTIENILQYGIYRYSTKFDYYIDDASKNILYYYYRKRSELTNYLLKKIEAYIEAETLVLDEDYNGFQDIFFTPSFEIEQLNDIFKNDVDFKNRVIEFYQMHLSYKSLEINGNIECCLKKGKEIEKQIPTGEPMPMINKSLLFEFRDKEKTEFEIIQLCTFIAVKSILGVKQYVKTNKKHIVSRIFGYASVMHLPKKIPANISVLFNKYSNRYHIDRVLQHLVFNWNVLTYSNNIRGMYISMSNKMTIDKLAIISESKKQKHKIDELKKRKQDAKNKALQQLNKGQHLNKEN